MSAGTTVAAVFADDAVHVARRLLGAVLLVNGVGGRIVETEAYDQADPASHTYCGPTDRNRVMFGPPGYAYVYRSYGLHWCFNMVCREAGHGAGVLIRALEPTHGLDVMRRRRGLQSPALLCSGPGRLAQALGIDRSVNGLSIALPPFSLIMPDELLPCVCGARIGLTKAVQVPWRFGLAGSRYHSRPFRPSARPG
jgi:DNA-3-methyladenine glycosylase